MTGFSNIMREQEDRSLDRSRRIAFVVNRDDSSHPDGKKLQRIQMRIAGLHDGYEDKDLPWFTPGGLDSFSGGSSVGNHGPVPPNGARVWTSFEDDSQYHGQYHGGVAHVDNQISEFVKPQSANTNSPTDGSSSTPGSDSSTTATDAKVKTNYDFTKNYPDSHGGVNESGDFHGHDPVTDYTEHTAVSGTGWQRDGRGNMSFTVSGNATRSDNSNASQNNLPEGFTAAVFGNGTVYFSKDVSISCKGNASINATGDASVTCKGKATVASEGDCTVSSKGKASIIGQTGVTVSSKALIELNSSSAIHINAPTILSQVPIVPGSSGSPASPTDVSDVQSQTAPTPRARPVTTAPTNASDY